METLTIHTLTQAVLQAFQRADADAAAFALTSAVACPSGCGACCSRPGGVEARVAEMLPAAFFLLAQGGDVATDIYQRVTDDPDGRCAFFHAESDDGRRGRCAFYSVRPGLCRLFGFASSHDKYGRRQLSTCGILRTEEWRQRVASGELNPPLIGAVSAEIGELAGALTSYGELLPINQALKAALTHAFIATTRDEECL